MKKIDLITSSLVVVIFIGFSACSDNAAFENAETLIPIVECNSTNTTTPALYTEMLSEDVLAKLVTPTTIRTYHDTNGTKTVCTEIGAAQLVR